MTRKSPEDSLAEVVATDGCLVAFDSGTITITRDNGPEVSIFVNPDGHIVITGQDISVIPVAGDRIHII